MHLNSNDWCRQQKRVQIGMSVLPALAWWHYTVDPKPKIVGDDAGRTCNYTEE